MLVIPEKSKDGSFLIKNKVARDGSDFELHAIDAVTSTLNSTFNADEAGVDLGFTSLKLFNVSAVEITDQPTADTDCVKTEIIWMPDYDIEIIGGKFLHRSPPSTNVRMWITGSPDFTREQGGNKTLTTGGINLKYVTDNTSINIDTKTTTLLKFNSGDGSNKFKITLRHDAGIKHSFQFIFDLYRLGV